MLVPKFVLTTIHHCRGEKGDFGRATQFRISDLIEEEAMIEGKSFDLFILLHFECLFGIKSLNRLCFSLTFCDAPISGGPVDNPSTSEISVLGRFAPKSWYRISTNYPWTPSYSAPLPYVPSPGPIHSYLNLKYEKKMNNYSP